MADEGQERRATRLLALGVAGGLALATWGLLAGGEQEGSLPAGAVASVNGVPILEERYAQALEALAADRRAPLGAAGRAFALERLIEEELLVQRGLALGLARHDHRLRGELVGTVLDQLLAAGPEGGPDAATLEAFFAAHRSYFARGPVVRVHEVVAAPRPGEPEAARRARIEAAARRLRAGEDAASIAREIGDPAVAAPPDALLPAHKLRDYLGPEATRRALALEPGAVSEPVATGTLLRVLRVEERVPARTPPLDEIREAVETEWRRRNDERRLRAYLDALREEADVRVADGAGVAARDASP